jgi:hypothetical protein
MELAFAPGCVFTAWAFFKEPDFRGGAIFFFTFFGLHAISGWFILKRRRWAWIIGSVLTFCPILWIANGSYLLRRWKELAAEAKAIPPEKRARTSVIVRMFLCTAGAGLMGFLAVVGRNGSRWNELPFGLAFGLFLSVAILFGVPWVWSMVWQFVLRHLAELSRAIKGDSKGAALKGNMKKRKTEKEKTPPGSTLPYRLTSEEIASLRKEAKEDSAWARAELTRQKAEKIKS